jgi:hypothetical protein
MSSGITVAIFNESTVLTDAQIAAVIPSLQKQVGRDFSPVWGHYATLAFVPKGGIVPPGAWQLGIFDDADQAGALGYHEESALGIPNGKVFAKTDLTYGSSWTVTISHELLEMLADPWIYNIVDGPAPVGSPAGEYSYCIEVCDAVEDDSLGYSIDGVLVSNFQTPHWFDQQMAGKKVAFDFCGRCTEPFQILAGGYMAVRPAGGQWTQVNAQGIPHRAAQAAPAGSRRERRAGKGMDLLVPTSRNTQTRAVLQAWDPEAHAFSTAIKPIGVVPPDETPSAIKASSGVQANMTLEVKPPNA